MSMPVASALCLYNEHYHDYLAHLPPPPLQPVRDVVYTEVYHLRYVTDRLTASTGIEQIRFVIKDRPPLGN